MQSKSIFFNYLLLFIKIWIFFSFPLYAQEGHFMLFDHNPNLQNIDNQNTSIIQGRNGVMYFANKKGILSYDGVKWDIIPTRGPVYSLALDTNSGKIYVGCKKNFGYLKKDQYSIDFYVSISDSLPANDQQNAEFKEITIIKIIKDQIYFYSNKVVFCYSTKNKRIENIWKSEKNESYTGLVFTNSYIYINIKGQGLNKVDSNGLSLISGGEKFSNVEIVTCIHYKNDTVLFGTSDNEVYLFDGKQLIPYLLEAKDYLFESILSGGINLSEEKFVLSTITGGCIFIDKKNGKTLNILNYQTGLQDDEIFSMGKDRNGGLWIAHDYGITRVDNTLPIKNYSSYPGLEGNLISVIEFDSTIYISTTEGIYYLTKVKDFKELIVYIKIPKQKEKEEPEFSETAAKKIYETIKIKNKDIPVETKITKQSVVESKRIKRLKRKLERLKKKVGISGEDELELEKLKQILKALDGAETETEAQIQLVEVKPVIRVIKKRVKKEYQIKKVYALQSVKYVYKQVNGFKGKCKQLIKFSVKSGSSSDINDRIFAASNTGLYEIRKQRMNSGKPEATPIIKALHINCIYQSKNPNHFFIGLGTGIKSIWFTQNKWQVEDTTFQFIQQSVYSIIEDDEQNLWVGCENNIYKIIMDSAGYPVDYHVYILGDEFSEIILIRKIFEKIFFITSSKIYCYISPNSPIITRSSLLWDIEQSVADIFVTKELNNFFSENLRLIYSQDHITWGYSGVEWVGLPSSHKNNTILPADSNILYSIQSYNILKELYLALFDNIHQIYIDSEKNIWLINGENSLYKINIKNRKPSNQNFEILIRKITDGVGTALLLKNLNLDHRNNSIVFSFATPFYINESSTQYQYFIEGVKDDWSEWNSNPVIHFPILPDGKTVIKFRAKNVLGDISNVKSFTIMVMPPFYKKWWFYSLCILAVSGLIFAFIKIRERNLKQQKKILEEEVQLRTAELRKKNSEIELKNKDIMSSINYAKRIQESILPLKKNILKVLPHSLIFYKPKDIVSGDFYWWAFKNGKTLIAAVDCTGHGVPGAFMSMIGNTLLNDIVNVKNIIKPSLILDELHTSIKTSLHQEQENSLSPDGMDISLCSIDTKKNEIQFAGAIQHICIVRNAGRIDPEKIGTSKPSQPFIEDIESDPFSIGGIDIKAGKAHFTNHTFQMQKNETIYLFSDGFEDQFGGEKNKKFSSDRFKNLLLNIHQLEMTKQEEIFNKTFEEWKGDSKQIDDILVIGIRF